MPKQDVLELWRMIKERLHASDFSEITSLFLGFRHGRIEKNLLISSARRLFKKDDLLHRRFTEFLCGNESPEEEEEQEDEEDGDEANDHLENSLNGDQKIEENVAVEIATAEARHEHLGLRRSLTSLRRQELNKNRSVTGGNIRGDDGRVITGDSFAGLEGKRRKRGRLHGKDSKSQIERSPKETRKSKRLEEVTPSYKHIFKEEQSPVSNKVLNNKYKSVEQRKGDVSDQKKLTEYEEVMAKCEDDMYEVDMLTRALKNAMESAEKVMRGDMRLEDVGVKFYRCIDQLYGQDMAETVRENQQKALPVIVRRLKQKMDELTVARERFQPLWKQVFEENSAKQRDGRKKK